MVWNARTITWIWWPIIAIKTKIFHSEGDKNLSFQAEEAEKERAEAELQKQREREALALAILNGTADKLELEKREKEENEWGIWIIFLPQDIRSLCLFQRLGQKDGPGPGGDQGGCGGGERRNSNNSLQFALYIVIRKQVRPSLHWHFYTKLKWTKEFIEELSVNIWVIMNQLFRYTLA